MTSPQNRTGWDGHTVCSDSCETIRDFIRYLTVPVLGWDPDYSITVFNPAMSQLTGYAQEEAIGQSISLVFPDADPAETAMRICQTSGRSGHLISVPLVQRSGDRRVILWTVIPLSGTSGLSCTLAQGRDITEQEWAKEYMYRYISELLEKNAELAASHRELEEINQTLDEKVQVRSREIEELLRQKEDFITQIGHDLKTPLTPLIAILPVLRKKEEDPRRQEFLDMAIRNAGLAHDILNSILNMARLNRTYVPGVGTTLEVFQMIEEIVVNLESSIRKRRVSIQNLVPADLSVYMNPLDFDTVFTNLIDNAVKFSRPGGIITVDGTRQDDRVLIRCIDTGIGILPREQRHIFEMFYKADPSRHDRESYGLGLSITRQIVERYGGTIAVVSEGENKGACFTVTLPTHKPWVSPDSPSITRSFSPVE